MLYISEELLAAHKALIFTLRIFYCEKNSNWWPTRNRYIFQDVELWGGVSVCVWGDQRLL